MTSVLVIDDSEVARASMARDLEGAGHTVFSRESAIGASAEIVEHRIEAVVLDVLMPVMGGERFAELVRKNERLHHVKVILVSSDRAQLLIAADKVGADAALTKEEVPTLLAATVSRLCKKDVASHGRLGVMVSGAQLVLPERGEWTVGRGEDCDLVLDDADASRVHARFVIGPDGVRLEDLDSKNGTQLNFKEIHEPTRIAARDEIIIGKTPLLVFDPQQVSWRATSETYDNLTVPEE